MHWIHVALPLIPYMRAAETKGDKATMSDYVDIEGFQVESEFYRFVEDELVPESGTAGATFWQGVINLVEQFAPRNGELLAERDRLQALIDTWHREHSFDAKSYLAYLRQIGYLVPEGSSFEIATTGVDPEIATIAGPQLVVPVTNARFALNAVNARWGSLYDALYGTDALGSPPPPGSYDPGRGGGSSHGFGPFSTTSFLLSGGRTLKLARTS